MLGLAKATIHAVLGIAEVPLGFLVVRTRSFGRGSVLLCDTAEIERREQGNGPNQRPLISLSRVPANGSFGPYRRSVQGLPFRYVSPDMLCVMCSS